MECEERAIKTSQELLLALPIEERTAEVAMGIEIIRSSISYLISHMPVESIQTLLEDPGLPQSLRAELIKKYAEFNYFAQFSSNEM